MTELPYVPYKGTAGWSGTSTSAARAMTNLRTGKEYNNQQKALAYLKQAGTEGLTWKELSQLTGLHHGTITGVLSVLHKSGAILRLLMIRDRCKVYIHQDYKDENPYEVYVEKKKNCPHCGHEL